MPADCIQGPDHARPRIRDGSAAAGARSGNRPDGRHDARSPPARRPNRSARNGRPTPARDSEGADRPGSARSGPLPASAPGGSAATNRDRTRAAQPRRAVQDEEDAGSASRRAVRRTASARRRSISPRSSMASASERALGKRLRSIGARRRSTQSPAARCGRWRRIASRSWFLTSVRVTARRACRFGTTSPSRRTGGPLRFSTTLSTDSSTDLSTDLSTTPAASSTEASDGAEEHGERWWTMK